MHTKPEKLTIKETIQGLYAYKSGKKPKKVKPVSAKSTMDGISASSYSSPFGSATSAKQGGSINTRMQLSGPLAPIPGLAGQGVQDNLRFLQQTPQQQYEQATGGNNPFYNLLAEQTLRNTDSALGRALVNAQGTGTTNSTTAGAAQGMIFNDAIIRQNQDLLNAINFSNDTSRANLGANLGALSGIANLIYPLGSAANANLMQASSMQDQVALQNAQAANQVALANAQAQNQYNLQRSQSLGQMIGGGIGLLGSAALAPFTGGASLLSAPGALGGMFGGGGSVAGASSLGGANLNLGQYFNPGRAIG